MPISDSDSASSFFDRSLRFWKVVIKHGRMLIGLSRIVTQPISFVGRFGFRSKIRPITTTLRLDLFLLRRSTTSVIALRLIVRRFSRLPPRERSARNETTPSSRMCWSTRSLRGRFSSRKAFLVASACLIDLQETARWTARRRCTWLVEARSFFVLTKDWMIVGKNRSTELFLPTSFASMKDQSGFRETFFFSRTKSSFEPHLSRSTAPLSEGEMISFFLPRDPFPATWMRNHFPARRVSKRIAWNEVDATVIKIFSPSTNSSAYLFSAAFANPCRHSCLLGISRIAAKVDSSLGSLPTGSTAQPCWATQIHPSGCRNLEMLAQFRWWINDLGRRKFWSLLSSHIDSWSQHWDLPVECLWSCPGTRVVRRPWWAWYSQLWHRRTRTSSERAARPVKMIVPLVLIWSVARRWLSAG